MSDIDAEEEFQVPVYDEGEEEERRPLPEIVLEASPMKKKTQPEIAAAAAAAPKKKATTTTTTTSKAKSAPKKKKAVAVAASPKKTKIDESESDVVVDDESSGGGSDGDKEKKVAPVPKKVKIAEAAPSEPIGSLAELVKRQEEYEANMEQRLKAIEAMATKQGETLSSNASRVARVFGVPMTYRQDYGTVDTLRFAVDYEPPRNILQAKFFDVAAEEEEEEKIWRVPGMNMQGNVANRKRGPDSTPEGATLASVTVDNSTRFGEHVNVGISEFHVNDKTTCVPYYMLAEQVQKNTRLIDFIVQKVIPSVAEPAVVLEMLAAHTDDLVLASVPHLREGRGTSRNNKAVAMPQDTCKGVFKKHAVPRALEMELDDVARDERAAKLLELRKAALAARAVSVPLRVAPSPQKKKKQQQELIQLFPTGHYVPSNDNEWGLKEDFYYLGGEDGKQNVTIDQDEAERMVAQGRARIVYPASNDFGGLVCTESIFGFDTF